MSRLYNILNEMISNPRGAFVAESYTKVLTVSGGGTYEGTATETKVGYYPLGIIGVATGSTWWVPVSYRLTSRDIGTAQVQYNVRSLGTSGVSANFVYQILWVKAS